MADSDSDLSTPANLPTDPEIESTLSRIVRTAIKGGEEITLKSARLKAEQELELPTDFFKTDSIWKTRSKEVIEAAVNDDPEDEEEEEATKEVKPKAKPKPAPKAGTKRKSDDSSKPQAKKRKKSPPVKSEESEDSELEEEKPEQKKPQTKSEDTNALSSPPDDESEPATAKQNGKHTFPAEDDDSDLSSVLDDPTPKKKSAPKSTTATSKSKPKAAKATKPAKTATKPDLSPDEEEIKRLQSWLLKCGIRKLWHRELAPYDTPKAKIKHLKSMLEDVGMTGRFSAEKARQIKESRELAAELESAREFNEQWGQEKDKEGGEDESEDDGKKSKMKGRGKNKEDDEDEDEVAPPVKRRPRGLVDFGDSGEDSD